MSVNANGLENYNPFTTNDHDDIDVFGATSGRTSPRAAQIPMPPPVNNQAEPSTTREYVMSGDTFRDDQMAEIKRKTAELDARAAELDKLEKAQNASQSSNPVNNWPYFPGCCPCKPFVRQDFNADINGSVRWIARYGYYLWLSYTLLLFLNVSGTVANFAIGRSNSSSALMGSSIIIALIMPIVTFVAWHRPLYNALRLNKSFQFFVFFIAMSIQIILLLIQVLGIDYMGSCGWINGLVACSIHKGVCGLMLVIATLFSAALVSSIVLLIMTHRAYRSAGIQHSSLPSDPTSAVINAAMVYGTNT